MSVRQRWLRVLLVCTAVVFYGCGGGQTGSDTGSSDIGTDGGTSACLNLQEGQLCAGAARVKLTPEFFETAKSELLEDQTKENPCVNDEQYCSSLSGNKLKTQYPDDWATKFFNDTNGDDHFDGYWLSGFNFSRPLQKVHDDIYAHAVVLRSPEKTVAIVSLDFTGFLNGDVKAILKSIQKTRPELGIAGLIVGSTHTHSSVDAMGIWSMEDPKSRFYVQGEYDYLGRVNDTYVDWVDTQIVSAISTAADNLAPVNATVASSRVGIDELVTDVRDPFVIDDTLSVLAFDRSQGGERVATIVNWGAHAESLGERHNYLSSDYVHYLREALEKGLPATPLKPAIAGVGGITLFLQASAGGMITPLGVAVKDRSGNLLDKIGFDRTRAIGETLAEKVVEIFKDGKSLNQPAVSFKLQTFRPPVENFNFYMLFNLNIVRKRQVFKIDPLKDDVFGNIAVETEMARLKIGPVTIQTFPGEPFPELVVGGYENPWSFSYGHPIIDPENKFPPDIAKAPAGPYFRDVVPGEYKFLVTIGQDELGYIIPTYDYKQDAEGQHYEESVSLGPSMSGMVGDNLAKMKD